MGPETKPVYKIPDHLLTGVEGQEFLVNNRRDKEEMARVVKEASLEVLRRTGGAGFPLLFSDYSDLRRIRAVKRGVERAGATSLIYHKNSNRSCLEMEVEEWLRRSRSKEEKRVLIADNEVSRGWECSHVLVVDLGAYSGWENVVMRTVGYSTPGTVLLSSRLITLILILLIPPLVMIPILILVLNKSIC